MIKKVSTLVLLLTVGAYSFPLSSPAAEPAQESGDASLLGEAVDWLTLRGEKVLNSARDEIRRLAGLDGAAPGTMAEVNGHPISLRQVEALYDMRTAGNRSGQAISLDELRAAYAAGSHFAPQPRNNPISFQLPIQEPPAPPVIGI